jgi:hypothetical protein
MDITSIVILTVMVIVVGIPGLANAFEASQNKKKRDNA